MYRVLRNLSGKGGQPIRRGTLVPESYFAPEAAVHLQSIRAISVVHAPPLGEIFDDSIVAQLEVVGVFDAAQLLEFSGGGVDNGKLVEWKRTAARWLTVDEPSHG